MRKKGKRDAQVVEIFYKLIISSLFSSRLLVSEREKKNDFLHSPHQKSHNRELCCCFFAADVYREEIVLIS